MEKKIEETLMIATYMDLEPVYSDKEIAGWKRKGTNWMTRLGNMEYHNDWRDLMPVVGKISKDIPCQLPEELNDFSDAFHFGLYEADITKVYSAVLQFIHFYNKTK